MNTLKQIGITILFTLVFTLSASAGEIQVGVIQPPPPPPAPSATALLPSTIDADEMQSPPESGILISEVTLTILQLLSVF